MSRPSKEDWHVGFTTLSVCSAHRHRAGVLVIVTRLVVILTVPAERGPLKAYVLTATHAINSVASIVAFALLVLALRGV